MKHNKLTIALSILGIFILGIGGTYLGFCINGSSPSYNEQAEPSRSNWMSYVEDDTFLSNIAMPGSHDGMSVDMHYMACCQNANMKQQLQMGVRYFDLRVNKVDNTLKIYHSIIDGIELKPCLENAYEFLISYPSETLILDFQHFKNDAEFDTYNMIHEVFDESHIIKNDSQTLTDQSFVSSLKLGESRGKAICIWGDYHRGSMADDHSDLFARNNDSCSYSNTCCHSYYDGDVHKKSSEEFINESIPKQFELATQLKQNEKLPIFVLQCQLTDGKLIYGPYAREKSHDENMSEVIKSLSSAEISIVNVILRDFLNVRKCGEIIRLNLEKNIVKENMKISFESSYNIYA